ncbi:hypothetical protein [Bacillus badius]|uniref:hypothetical protein n=1 Tax=Bacillus badius TaxID=1455 RepID=UPI0005979BCC|nr:hypothetical protein [Bacillus badius]KIL74049.1 hypothetical protein SD78_3107 [Bacillus badius]
MKKISLFFLLIAVFTVSACSSPSTDVTKEYIEKNTKENLSKKEVEKIFGKPKGTITENKYESWLYDSGENVDDGKPSLESVASEDIMDEKIKYQLFVVFEKDKAIQYSYFYKKDDNVWQYRTTGKKGSASDEQASTFDE